MLIAKGAKIDASKENGFGTLRAAAQNGDKEVAERLITKGIDVNVFGAWQE